MRLKEIFIICLIFIVLLIGCTKEEDNTNNDIENESKAVEVQQVVIEKEVPVEDKDKSVDEIKEPEPVSTDEGFVYGEWNFLSGINNYLPDYSVNVKIKVVESKVWILKDGEEFNPDDPADNVKYFDAKGNRIKNISYTRDVSGNIYKYDLNNRLVSITPVIDDEVRENKRITLKYFKKEDGSILRKSYVGNELVLEEIETKTEDGWEYSWKEPDQNKFHRVVIIQNGNLLVEFVRYYASGGSTKFTFEYEDELLKRVNTIDADDKIPYRIYEYSYGENGLLKEEDLFDPRKEPKVIMRNSIYSNYDENGNWQKKIAIFDTGGKEIVIRRFTYAAE